ncbi:hypothetical protein [Phaeovulum veldkampii]|nr:hypothetical protein [Phaeovulum veldkampii]
MMAPRGNARGLVEWSRRDPWRERMAEMVERHIRRACDLNDIDIYDLPDVIGEHAMVAMDCAFEDCCTATWEDGSNLANDYLKRRGWKETVINRSYIEALRDSVVSLYEVSDVRPGESFLARDLFRGGDPIRVTERTATKTLVQWDVIATRIITVRGVVQMAAAVLAVERELADEMLALMRRTQSRAPEAAAEIADPEFRTRLETELVNDETLLSIAAPAITTLWLNDTIRRYHAPLPELANTDGEKLEFMTLHYRLLPGITVAKVAEALAGTPDIRDEDDGKHWIWFAPEKPGRKGRTSAQADHEDTGRTIYGHLTLGPSKLEVMVNSEDRATRIRNILAPILDGLVQPPLTERITPEQAMAERGGARAPAPRSLPEGMSPEDMREAVHQFLDRQYRNVLRQKVPALGDKTPRQAVRSAKGRQAVANWLKGLEQNNARLPTDDPMHDYDFSWMWEELGITDLRS